MNLERKSNKNKLKEIQKQERYHLLDGIRGIVLVGMIAYHFCWNMVYLYGANWTWYRSTAAYVWQQSICWTFILLSGFCWQLSRNHLKRGLFVFGGGLLVTGVTLAVMPQNRVVFGVLTLIGSCILLMIPLAKVCEKNEPKTGMLRSFAFFILTRNINKGYLGFETINLVRLSRSWYQNNLTAYLGMPQAGFYSTDYFSLIPWFFLFVTGYYLFSTFQKNKILDHAIWKTKIPFFGFLGRHSLLIYLLHQPVIYLIQEILHSMGGN